MDATSLADLPDEMLYRIVVESGSSVRELRRLCTLDRRFRVLCKDEYIWLRLYFIKIARSKELKRMKDQTEARRFIHDELMNTAHGRLWSSYRDMAEPYVLLLAFAMEKHMRRTLMYADASRVTWRDGQGAAQALMYLNGTQVGVNLMGVPDAQEKMRMLVAKGTHIHRFKDRRGVFMIEVENLLILFITSLLQGWVPHFEGDAGYRPSNVPDALKTQCVLCGNPAFSMCGYRCGRAVYCGDACAQDHWKEHRDNCKK